MLNLIREDFLVFFEKEFETPARAVFTADRLVLNQYARHWFLFLVKFNWIRTLAKKNTLAVQEVSA